METLPSRAAGCSDPRALLRTKGTRDDKKGAQGKADPSFHRGQTCVKPIFPVAYLCSLPPSDLVYKTGGASPSKTARRPPLAGRLEQRSLCGHWTTREEVPPTMTPISSQGIPRAVTKSMTEDRELVTPFHEAALSLSIPSYHLSKLTRLSSLLCSILFILLTKPAFASSYHFHADA